MKLSELGKHVLALESVLLELSEWTGFEIQEKYEELFRKGQQKAFGKKRRGRPIKRVVLEEENSQSRQDDSGDADDVQVERSTDPDVGPVSEGELRHNVTIQDHEDHRATKDVVLTGKEVGDEESNGSSGGFEITPDSGPAESEDYEFDSDDEDDEDEGCDPLSDAGWSRPFGRKTKRRRKRNSEMSNEGSCSDPGEEDDEEGEGPHPCAECGETCPSASALRKHRRRVHNEKKPLERVCEYCQKIFTHKQHYITHLRVHTGERPFLCSVCAFSTKTNSMLTKHMQAMHPETPREKNVKCDHCNKLFLTKSGLRKHVTVEHSDEWKKNRAQCSICLVVFRDIHKLKRHIEDIHEDKRSFACELCGQLFKRMSHLKSHILRHNNPKRRRRGQQKPKIRGTPVPPIAQEEEQEMFGSFGAESVAVQHDQIEIGAPPNPSEVTQEVFFITEEPAKVVEVDMSEAAFHMEFLQ